MRLELDDSDLDAIAARVVAMLGDQNSADGWLAAPAAVEYLGLGSLDALDRAVIAGLPYAQPHGPGGRRYFRRRELDRWMEGGA